MNSINANPAQALNSVQQFQELQKSNCWRIVQDVAMTSFCELAVSMAFVALTSVFVATAAGVSLLVITAVAIVAINTFVRSIGGFLTYCLEQNQNYRSSSYYLCKKGVLLCNYIAPTTFSFLDLTTRNIVIHEGGHALAANLLIQKANPTITIIPFQGGATSIAMEGLTRLGQVFGEKRSMLIISAAGPAAAVLANTLQIGIAQKISKINPTLSRYLNVTAITSLAHHILYALSTFIPKCRVPGHDFAALWLGGIHPIASIVGMVALPIIVKVGLYTYDHALSCKKAPISIP